MQSDPQGRFGRRDAVARLHAARVGALTCLDRDVELADGVGDLAEQGALGRPGEAPGLDRRQQLERPPPLAALHGPPRALDGFPAGVLAHREANVTPSVT